jgi:hypothetical protein
MEVLLMQIPVLQRMRKQDEDGEPKEMTRVVPELISPTHIVRVSPTETGTVIWLAHGAPYVECKLTYPQFIEELQKLSGIEQQDGNTTDTAEQD